MKEIRNANGKLICRLDKKKGIIEIARKGCKTKIHFKPSDKIEIINEKSKYINH